MIAFDPGHSALVRIPAVIFQFAWFVVLFSITVKRFGRITRHDDRSPTQSIDTRHQTKLQLTNPRRSPLSAIIWKQWRQTLPLCVLGLILFVLFTCLLILANSPTSGHYDETTNRIIFTKMDYLKFVGLQFRFAAIIIGPLLALVVGIAAASSELNSRLLAFWGSRPISRSLWFWAMYLSGGLLFMLTIYLPIVLVSFFQNPDHLIQLKVYVAAMTPLLVLIYTFAVFCACSLRHTFYAIVMASALSLAYIAIPTFNSHLEFFSVTDIWRSCEISLNNNSNIWQISAYPYYLTVTFILTAAILFLARAAAQCNNQPIADE